MATRFINRIELLQVVDQATLGTGTVSLDTSTARVSGTCSIKCNTNAGNLAASVDNALAGGTNGRCTLFMNFAQLPAADSSFWGLLTSALTNTAFILRLTSAGNIKLMVGNTPTLVTTGTFTMPTNTWVRLSMAWTITSTTVWSFRLRIGSSPNYGSTVLDITSDSAGTLATAVPTVLVIGWVTAGQAGANAVLNYQHLYADDSSALTDIGDMRVTAKLPTTRTSSGFTTTVGTGAVNERPISATNARGAPSSASLVTEGYSIEANNAGDIDISPSNFTQVAYTGCVYARFTASGAAPTANGILNGASTAVTLTASSTVFGFSTVDSSTYPATSQVIGMSASGTGELAELDECGIVIAYKVNSIAATASQAQTAQAVKQISVTKLATESQTALLLKQVGKLLFATETQSAANSTRQTNKILIGTQGQSSLLLRQVNKLLVAAEGQTAQILRQVGKQMVAAESTTASQLRAIAITRFVSQAVTPQTLKQVAHSLIATQAQSALLTAMKVLLRTLIATQAATALLTRQAGKSLIATQAETPSLLRQIQAIRIATETASAMQSRAIAITHIVAQSTTAIVVKGIQKLLYAVESMTARLLAILGGSTQPRDLFFSASVGTHQFTAARNVQQAFTAVRTVTFHYYASES